MAGERLCTFQLWASVITFGYCVFCIKPHPVQEISMWRGGKGPSITEARTPFVVEKGLSLNMPIFATDDIHNECLSTYLRLFRVPALVVILLEIQPLITIHFGMLGLYCPIHICFLMKKWGC